MPHEAKVRDNGMVVSYAVLSKVPIQGRVWRARSTEWARLMESLKRGPAQRKAVDDALERARHLKPAE